jgi:hypothetical protein|nr:MAG TPA: hypothetical protein [Caudoviricetes sp.]DAW33806.1 MAG TPA: hypothetical protein [Caudoviricetes sp.]
MAIDSIPNHLIEKVNKEKLIKDNITPISIEIDDEVVYFMTSDNPNKKYSLTKNQIRNIFGSL